MGAETIGDADRDADAKPGRSGQGHGLAAVAYLLTWLTGLIVFLVADKEDSYTRWHALQAIGLGIVVTIVWWIVGYLAFLSAAGAAMGGGPGTILGVGTGFGLLSGLWTLLVLIAVIVLAVKAYQGEKVRLPFLADIADDHA